MKLAIDWKVFMLNDSSRNGRMNVWNINWPFVLDRARRLGKRFATRNFGFTSQHCFIYTSSFSKQHYSLQLKKCFNGSALIVWRHCQQQSLFMAIKRTSKSISETWIAARRMILASGASIHLNEKSNPNEWKFRSSVKSVHSYKLEKTERLI